MRFEQIGWRLWCTTTWVCPWRPLVTIRCKPHYRYVSP